jgi:endonuclease YncB( thermonuclease family)
MYVLMMGGGVFLISKGLSSQKKQRKKRVSMGNTCCFPLKFQHSKGNAESPKDFKIEQASHTFQLTCKDEVEEEEKLLLSTNFDNVSRNKWDGQKKLCKVLRVIDGDTVEIGFFVDKHARKDSLRVFGIDSPELHALKSSALCEIEKEAAVIAKDVLTTLLLSSANNIVWVEFHKADKYGRLLGSLFVRKDNKNVLDIQKWLIDHKVCKPYFGKKKESWTRKELKEIVSQRETLLKEAET